MTIRCLALMVALLCACEDQGVVLSGEGESCTRTADCEAGLVCIDLVCEAKEVESDVVEPYCPPGVTQICMCDAHRYATGTQTCDMSGEFWSPCDCGFE